MKHLIISAVLLSSTVASAHNYGNQITNRCLQGGGDTKVCRDAGTVYSGNQFALGLVGLATGGPVGMHLAPFVAHEVEDSGLWIILGLFAWAPSWFLSWQFMRLADHIQRKATNADKREFEALQAQNA